MNSQNPLAGREVYFEFRQIGHAVKVTAIDALTAIEVSIPAPANMPEALLQARALKRLEYVLRKEGYIA